MSSQPLAKPDVKPTQSAPPPMSPVVRTMVAKWRYQPPKIMSFPLDGLASSDPLSMAGNG